MFIIFAAERFQEIKKAHSILSEPKERELYDIFLGTGLAVPFELWKKEHETHGAVHWRGRLAYVSSPLFFPSVSFSPPLPLVPSSSPLLSTVSASSIPLSSSLFSFPSL